MDGIVTIGGKHQSSYLLPCGEEGYCLIDAGPKWRYEDFLKQLSEKNVPLSSIRYVVLTHIHSLHTGFLKPLLQATKATVVYDVRDKRRLEAGKNNLNTYVTNFVYLVASKVLISPLFLEKMQCFPSVFTDRYADAKTQPLAEYGIEFIFLKGHTEYDVCVKYGDALFCGDLCASGLFSSKRAPVWIYNKYDLLMSWKTILSLNVHTIYPDFGKPFAASELEKSIEFWRSRGVFRL